LLALVVAGGKAFGQAATTPGLNSTPHYGMYLPNNNGDSYSFSVTIDTEVLDPTNTTTDASVSNVYAVVTGDSATCNVTWGTEGDYNLWITVTDDAGTTPSNCSNYTYITISVTNNFNATIYAIAINDGTFDTGLDWTDDPVDDNGCHVFVNPDFENGSSDNGQSYIYLVVQKLADNGSGTAATWGFSVSDDATGTVEYWNGTTWGSAPSGLAMTTERILLRTLVTNTAAQQIITATVSASETTGSETATDITPADDDEVVTLLSMPNLNAATFE